VVERRKEEELAVNKTKQKKLRVGANVKQSRGSKVL
jgi:hypothetical protein